jgi:hypothetical protein
MRLRYAAVLPAVAALVLLAGATTTAMASPAVTQSFCSSVGPIPASSIAGPVSLSQCPIQGRSIVRSGSTGQVGVNVPGPGYTNVGIALTTHGDYALSVTNDNGQVKTSTSLPSTQVRLPAGAARSSSAALPPQCTELGYSPEGVLWNTTLNWYYNESTASRAGLSGATTLSNIRTANSNVTLGANNCGFTPTTGFNAYGAYQGTTTRYANINSAGDETSNFPDGQNTVSWGPFNAGLGDLAVTAYEYDDATDFVTESDTYLGSNVAIATSIPAGCTSNYDLTSIMAHEWGHAYGLGDLTSAAYEDQLMYQYFSPCEIRSTLGEGDWNGMGTLYGYR